MACSPGGLWSEVGLEQSAAAESVSCLMRPAVVDLLSQALLWEALSFTKLKTGKW